MQWELWTVLSRLTLFICMALTVGALFCCWLSRQHKLEHPVHWQSYLTVAGLGVLSATASFLFFIGSIAMTGVSGMFDHELIWMLLPDGTGQAMLWQWATFTLLALSLLIRHYQRLQALMQLAVVLMLLFSFTLGGHLLQHGLIGRLALGLHLLCIGLWIGALPVLWRLCQHHSASKLQPLMQQFGQLMVVVLLVLIGSGLGMLLLLLSEPSQLWQTTYGRIVLLKLGLVSLLMGLGAYNKLRLVPALHQPAGLVRLKKTIALEMLLAVSVFITTVVLTTIIGWSN